VLWPYKAQPSRLQRFYFCANRPFSLHARPSLATTAPTVIAGRASWENLRDCGNFSSYSSRNADSE
jgi:hypothetical protein